MAQDRHAATQQVRQRAKEDFLKKFNSAYIERPMTLGSPICKQHCRRYYVYGSKKVYDIAVFAQIALKDESAQQEAINQVRASFAKAISETEQKMIAAQTLMTSNGVTSVAQFNQPTTEAIRLVAPESKLHIQLYEMSDEYHRMILTLWIEGEINDEEKRKAEKDIKRRLRAVLQTINNMSNGLTKRIREQNKEGELRDAVGADIEEIDAESEVVSRQAKADEDAIGGTAPLIEPIDSHESEDAEPATAAGS